MKVNPYRRVNLRLYGVLLFIGMGMNDGLI